MNEREIEELLAQAVKAYRQLPKKIGVGEAIEAVTNQKVIPLSGDGLDKELIHRVCDAAKILIERSQNIPIRTGRLNELGNNIEGPLREACLAAGLEATWPTRRDGSGARSGYPDLAINIGSDRPTYLEAKVIGAGSESSSFRSFYLSPSDNPKVCHDARHLLVAFAHERRENASDGLEQYALTSFKVVDLALVLGTIKFEYQSSNKDMYLGKAVVARG